MAGDDEDFTIDDDQLVEGDSGEQSEVEDLEPEVEAPEVEADGDDDGDEPVVAAPKVNRAQERITRLNEERKRAQEEAALLRAKVQEFEAERARASRADPELERQKLELMDPGERAEYMVSQMRADMQRQQELMRFQLMDTEDKASFRQLAATDKKAAKLADDVERLYREQASKGQFVDRKTIYYFELGRRVAAQGTKAAPKAQAERTARVARATAPSSGSKSDVGSGGRSARSIEERYGDVPI